MRKILLLSLAFLVGCTSTEKKFNTEIEGARCETALENIPENASGAKLISKTQQAGGVALSYAVTGVAYTGEVLIDFVGGTVMFVALCSPAIALGAIVVTDRSSGSYSGNWSGLEGLCIPGKVDALFIPPLGRKTFEASKDLRCPDLVGMSRSLRKVASCFSHRAVGNDLEKADQTLTALQNSERFFECLPEEEQNKITSDLKEIAAKARVN